MGETAGHDLALFTDFYELTMCQAYFDRGMTGSAVFTLFVRRLPEQRNVLLACGLDTVLEQLETLRFTGDDCRYLASLGRFSDAFLAWLPQFRFTGDVYAMPEGTPVFANEPILEVVAPLPEAQLIETLVMNQVHLQTMLASKGARVVRAAQRRTVIDFGSRRGHGIDAAVSGARAFYVAGVDATSNVLAGKRYGIPVSGTMAHSYIQAHGDEREAFAVFARIFPGTVLLVDTYDTLGGVRHVIDLVRRAPEPVRVSAIRLDSGDLDTLSRESRRLLDEAGLAEIRIVASGGLDEYSVDALVRAGAPIDGFGVGTSMSVSADVPSLDIVYKLSEYGGRGRTKLSTGKPVLPGRKQVFRLDGGGRATADVIARADERVDGRPLLELVMQEGRRVRSGQCDLGEVRAYASREMRALPDDIVTIAPASEPYPVRMSPALEQHHRDVMHEVRRGVRLQPDHPGRRVRP